MVERTIQKRRLYFEEEESDKAPKIRTKCGLNHSWRYIRVSLLTDNWLCYQPTDGTCQPDKGRQVFREAKTQEERCAISATIISAIHIHRSIAYPSSTVHAICAPAIEILRVMRSQCVNRFPDGALELLESSLSPSTLALPPATEGGWSTWPLAGHGIWVVGSGSPSAMGGIMLSQGGRKVSWI